MFILIGQAYIDEKFAKPMGWGTWSYCLYRGDVTMAHANGAGSIALHATDAVRFGYCLAQGGRWQDRQLIPADYIKLCQQSLPYNPHFPFSLQFEHNAAGQILGAPRDVFYKTGAGGFCLYVVPSLDLVIYKLGGKDNQYDPALTGLPPIRVTWDLEEALTDADVVMALRLAGDGVVDLTARNLAMSAAMADSSTGSGSAPRGTTGAGTVAPEGPNTSSGKSTKTGPRCGDSAVVTARLMVVAVRAGSFTVSADLVIDDTIGT